jgi:hypothetical protein
MMQLEINGWLGIVLLGLIVFMAFGIFVCAARSSGEVVYCYIDHDAYEGYRVKGHREWRPDVTIGIASSAEIADNIFRQSAICSKK